MRTALNLPSVLQFFNLFNAPRTAVRLAPYRAAMLRQSAHGLGKGATLELSNPGGTTLTCTKGSLWITHDNDVKDTILRAGQAYTSERNTRLLAFALDDASVSLC